MLAENCRLILAFSSPTELPQLGREAGAAPVAAGGELAAAKRDGKDVLRLLDHLSPHHQLCFLIQVLAIFHPPDSLWNLAWTFFAEDIKTSALENDEQAAKG